MVASQPLLPQLPSLSELESRMQVMRVSTLEENQTGETSSQRDEWFYKKRPLLLSLCQDLYDGYATLLDRFNQTKPQNTNPTIPHENDSDTEITSEVCSQQMQVTSSNHHVDELVLKLMTANFEKDIELQRKEQKFRKATKTIELLKKIVMLLDMEKEVVVEEITNLGYKLDSLLEENRELATEAAFMKKEAVRLARCLLKMRDEHFRKVCLLENQIYEMEESSSQFVYENVSSSSSLSSSTPSCFGLDSSSNKSKNKKRKMSDETRSEEHGEKKRRSKWLKRLNIINPFINKCKP